MRSISKLAVLSASLAVTLGALPAWSSIPWCEDGTFSWKVSVVPDKIAGVCDGGRGFVRVENNRLAYFIEGSRTPN